MSTSQLRGPSSSPARRARALAAARYTHPPRDETERLDTASKRCYTYRANRGIYTRGECMSKRSSCFSGFRALSILCLLAVAATVAALVPSRVAAQFTTPGEGQVIGI